MAGYGDLSKKKSNPTASLTQHYQELMAIQDPDALIQRVTELAKPLVGAGMSELNYRKLVHTMEQYRQNFPRLQKYVTDYILKGMGLGVVEDHVQAVASLLTEGTAARLTPQQAQLKRLAESYGYHVALLSPNQG